MPDFDYMLKVASATLHANVLLNDCLVFRHTETRLREAELKLTPWIVQGHNRLEVRIEEPGEPALGALRAAGEEVPEPTFVLSGHVVPKIAGQCLDANEFLRYRWTEGETPLPGAGPATVLKHHWLVQEEFGPWVWESARPFEPQDRAAVVALVAQLHALMLARNLNTLEALLAVKTDELCQAYGFDLTATRREHMEFLRSAVSAEDFELDPPRDDKLRLELDAGGRLVRVLDAEGRPPLLGRANGRPLAYDLTLSHVDGAWLVVR